jgi:hypothetical protein
MPRREAPSLSRSFLTKESLEVNFTMPIVLLVICIALAGLIFWGGFSEERRARRG